MFGQRPHEPQFGPNTRAITQMLQELRAQALTPQSIAQFGANAYNHLVDNQQFGFAELLHKFVEAQDAVALWRFQHRRPGDDSLAGHALRILAVAFGHAMPAYTNGYDVLGEAQTNCQKSTLYYAEGTDEHFLSSERVRGIEMLRHEYYRRATTLSAIENLIPSTDEWDLSDRVVEQYYRQAVEMAGYLEAYSAYTVKPCFVQDGLFHSPSEACVILDGPELYGKLRDGTQSGYAIPYASMHITKRHEIKTTDFQLVPNDPYGKTATLTGGYKILLGFDVHHNGMLAVDSYGCAPLQHLFEAAGRPEVFPVFWLMQLMRLCDLVIPVDKQVQHGIPAFPRLEGPRKAREKQAKNLHRDFPLLWLPRIRALADGGTPAAVELEIAQDEAFTQQTARKAPEHVVGHWRRLKPHQKASPAAIENARNERKMAPPEGYTYVKKRGQSTGHEVRRSR